MTQGKLVFKDGTKVLGESFGKNVAVAGEVVFTTGMVGYPESLTDPSYRGQILVLTYPLIGNYGVPDPKTWESSRIQILGLIVSSYIDTPSHYTSTRSLGQWLRAEGIPALEIKDTRFLTQKLRSHGVMLGKMTFEKSNVILGRPRRKVGGGPGIQKLDSRLRGNDETGFSDPNQRNLVAEVSTRRIKKAGKGKLSLILVDCGAKKNIERCLIGRGFKVIIVPWNYDFLQKKLKFDAVVISNGPGDPKMACKTIEITRRVLAKKTIPVLGICLGNQILALAAGGDTYKLKFGHRGQNQPCYLVGSKRIFLTTQNHGYAVRRVPKNFRAWFTNANDQTNEGIIHKRLPLMSVQFHPEAHPGPTDTEWIFDYFLERVRGRKS